MIILSNNKYRRPCLVFNARNGVSYGYTNANALNSGERVEDLAGSLNIPVSYVAWFNFRTGLCSSYGPVIEYPSEVYEYFDSF